MCCPGSPEVRHNAKIKELELAPDLCLSPKRKLVRCRFDTPIWELDVHEDCYHNQLRAVKGRVLGKVPPLDPIMASLLRPAVRQLALSLKQDLAVVSLETSILQFPQRRRKRYAAALVEFLSRGWIPKDATISAFVKMEKLQILLKNGDPRMIQTRHPVFHLVFSQMTKPVEHALMHLKDPVTGGVMIAKGLNLNQRAQVLKDLWVARINPVAISLDLSRWDMHVQVPLLQEVFKVYTTHNPCPLIRLLMENLLNNKCWTNQGIRYQVEGGVMSGDMTTALGNCLAVVAIVLTFRKNIFDLVTTGSCDLLEALQLRTGDPVHAEICDQLKEVPRGTLTEDWLTLLDDGDDHVLIVERQDAHLAKTFLPVWWRLMGHSLKVEGEAEALELVEFCQHRPFDGSQLVMVPNPRKVLAKSLMVTGAKLMNPLPYLRTVCLARFILHNGIPVLGPFFHRQWELLGPGLMMDFDGSEFQHCNMGLYQQMQRLGERRGIIPPTQTPTEEDRYLFWKMWDITPHHQLLLESLDCITDLQVKLEAGLKAFMPTNTSIIYNE